MRTSRLPIFADFEPEVRGAAPGLVSFLAEIGDALIESRIGKETSIAWRRLNGVNIEVTRGAAVKSSSATVTGMRYLYRLGDDTGTIVGAANITVIAWSKEMRRAKAAVVSNIVVAEYFRGLGIATALVNEARNDFPQLSVDSSMTVLGGRFFGYAPDVAGSSVPHPADPAPVAVAVAASSRRRPSA